ncbi:HNH endonuclease [Facklamia sp. P12932]|uniref:HNH endonuclease n=1 Tax=Facklamia sp. P12932 TaxID=3421947 RepID=UPI003D17499B
MGDWLIPCNINKHDLFGAFNKLSRVSWKQSKNILKDDIVYIYVSKPISGIVFKCIAIKVNLPSATINDEEFVLDGTNYENYGRYMELELVRTYDKPVTLDILKANGLKGNPQGPRRITGSLLNFLEKYHVGKNIFDYELTEREYFEGKASKIYVNKFERNSMARKLAIEYHGCKCSVCGFDFYEKYGEIGKDYIQVHHVVPIHSIGNEYKVNFKDDLVPLCANCHVMVHQKINGQELTVKELRNIFIENIK